MISNFQFPFLNIQLETTAWLIVKLMAILGLLMYSLFAAVVIKQVGIMAQTIDDPANGKIKVVAWIHLVFALVVTGIIIVFL